MRVGTNAVAAQPASHDAAGDVRVITFNTAVGNPKIKTRPEDFLKLPFYQDIIQGKPNAPILAGQEIAPAQLDALEAASKNGNFNVVHIGRPPGFKGQNNVIVVPKRYQILEAQSHYYARAQLDYALHSIKTWFHDKKLPSLHDLSQIVEPRMWSEVRLKDSVTGKTFTVFNTHSTLLADRREGEMKTLLAQVEDAKKRGPVILAGDLNTRTAADPSDQPGDATIRAMIADAGLKDSDATQGRIAGRSNIDWILSDGFSTVQSKHYTGDSISLPGSPTAREVSDHYAEEAVLHWS